MKSRQGSGSRSVKLLIPSRADWELIPAPFYAWNRSPTPEKQEIAVAVPEQLHKAAVPAASAMKTQIPNAQPQTEFQRPAAPEQMQPQMKMKTRAVLDQTCVLEPAHVAVQPQIHAVPEQNSLQKPALPVLRPMAPVQTRLQVSEPGLSTLQTQRPTASVRTRDQKTQNQIRRSAAPGQIQLQVYKPASPAMPVPVPAMPVPVPAMPVPVPAMPVPSMPVPPGSAMPDMSAVQWQMLAIPHIVQQQTQLQMGMPTVLYPTQAQLDVYMAALPAVSAPKLKKLQQTMPKRKHSDVDSAELSYPPMQKRKHSDMGLERLSEMAELAPKSKELKPQMQMRMHTAPLLAQPLQKPSEYSTQLPIQPPTTRLPISCPPTEHQSKPLYRPPTVNHLQYLTPNKSTAEHQPQPSLRQPNEFRPQNPTTIRPPNEHRPRQHIELPIEHQLQPYLPTQSDAQSATVHYSQRPGQNQTSIEHQSNVQLAAEHQPQRTSCAVNYSQPHLATPQDPSQPCTEHRPIHQSRPENQIGSHSATRQHSSQLRAKHRPQTQLPTDHQPTRKPHTEHRPPRDHQPTRLETRTKESDMRAS